jgi:hypothetical protein
MATQTQSKVDVSLQQLSGNQPTKLPIPRLQNTGNTMVSAQKSTAEMLLSSGWSTTTPLLPTLAVIPQNPLSSTIGKPVPNKRGRKPLTAMPSTKKHMQNLTNQRAFRQRRENYIRSLENKAATLEILYAQAREEIKTLKEQLASLGKQRLNGGDASICTNGLNTETMDTQFAQKLCAKTLDSCCGVDRSMYTVPDMENHDLSGSQLFGANTDNQQKNGLSCDVVMGDSLNTAADTSDHQKRDQQSPSHLQSQQDALNDSFLLNPMFCEPKTGELCYCDPESVTEADPFLKTPTIAKCYVDEATGKRMWIIPKDVLTPPFATPDSPSQYYPTTYTLPSPDEPEPHWLQQQQYYNSAPPPTPPSNGYTNGQLELKWMMEDSQRGEGQTCGGTV